MASLGRAAGWGQRGVNIATTVANATQGGFTNSYTLYQQAKAYGASEQQARCAAGWGFLAGTTTAIPVTQWSLRLERGAEVFAPLSRMTLEAVEAGGQGLVLGGGNDVIAQQIYDKNRDVLEGIVGATALNSGAAGIISFLTSVVARARHTPIDYKIKRKSVDKSSEDEWAVLVNGKEVFRSPSEIQAKAVGSSYMDREAQLKWLQDTFAKPGKVKRVGDSVEAVIGVKLTDKELSDLAGAPSNSRVKVTGSIIDENVIIEVESDLTRELIRTIKRDSDDHLILYNISFEKNKEFPIPRGFGANVSGTQVKMARSLGFKEIRAFAVGSLAAYDEYNGYWVWPRLGFDSELSPEIRQLLPDSLAKAKSLLDLYQSQEGRNWWEVNGGNHRLTFALNPNSRNSKVHQKYLDTNNYRLRP